MSECTNRAGEKVSDFDERDERIGLDRGPEHTGSPWR